MRQAPPASYRLSSEHSLVLLQTYSGVSDIFRLLSTDYSLSLIRVLFRKCYKTRKVNAKRDVDTATQTVEQTVQSVGQAVQGVAQETQSTVKIAVPHGISAVERREDVPAQRERENEHRRK